METWLSYIQPWRYMVVKSARMHHAENSEEKDRSVNVIWNKFITENLAFYTIIFQRTLPRFFRMDLSTPKNAYMLYRVAKVYSQPNLYEMISDAEYGMQEPSQRIGRLAATPHTFVSSDSPSLSSAVVSSGAAIVRQQLMELERPGYQYTPLFGDEIRAQIHQLLLLIVQARQVAQAMLNAPENGNSGFFSQLKRTMLSLFDVNSYPQGADEYTPMDNRKVDVHLEIASNHLCNLFHLQMPIMQQNGIVSSNISEASSSTSSSRTLKSLPQAHSGDDGISELQKKYGNKQMEVAFRGNPDLQPIRSYEIGLLVRWLYQLATYLNNKYRLQLRKLYHRRNFVGYFCKQFLEKPIIYYEYNKDVYPPMRQKNVLPPRFSFRCVAHKQRLGYMLGLFLVAYSWGYNPLIVFILLLGCILTYATIKAAFLSVYNYRES